MLKAELIASRENTVKLPSLSTFRPHLPKETYRFICGVTAALVLFCVLSGCKSTHRTFDPGSKAPEFTMQDVNGTPVSLADVKGKAVLLVLWATWCETCKSQIPALKNLQARYQNKNFVILAPVVNDSKDAYREYVRQFPLPYHSGTAREDLASLYKITGVPEAFVLDREGRFVLLNDAASQEATVRIVGPRQWDSPEFAAQFERIIAP